MPRRGNGEWTFAPPKGPSIKYVTLEGRGGGPRRCDSLWQREGVKSVTLIHFFYHTYETWNFKWCLTFCCNTCILTEGRTDKKHPGQNLPDKRQNPRTKPPQTIEREFVQGAFVGLFVISLLKIGGSEMYDVLWGAQDVWQSVTGGGESKLARNSVTYFMNDPYI